MLPFCNQTPTDYGTPRNKQLWKQQHMDQSLWQPKQPQNRSWIYDTHSGTLVYPSGLNHICLVITGLWLQVLHYHTQQARGITFCHSTESEAVAAKIIDFHWIKSEYNLGDMLSKHWEHSNIFAMIQKLLITCRPIKLIP